MSEFADGVTAPEETKEGTPTTSAEEKYLSRFVGDDKPYKTVEEAAEALAKKAVNADPFIEQLKTELHEYKNKYNEVSTKNKSIDEILEALRAEEKPVVQQQSTTEPPKGLSVEEVLAELQKRQQEEAQKTARATAIEKTWDTLAQEFKSLDTAKSVVAKYIGKDESKKAIVNSLAVSDPAALIQILKPLNETVQFTEGHDGKPVDGMPSGKLTWELVRKIKKDNPKLYQSHAFQNRMHAEL